MKKFIENVVPYLYAIGIILLKILIVFIGIIVFLYLMDAILGVNSKTISNFFK